MRIENNHAHAYTRYDLLSWKDYWLLMRSVFECRVSGNKDLTVHLPFEIQHSEVRNLKKGKVFIYYGEFLKKLFGINLYWENAPWLNYGTWDLKYGNTDWKHIPKDIEICLDTGHLMLGSKNKRQFLKKLNKVLKERGVQIKYLHLHENNFKKDMHTFVPGKIIKKKLMEKLIENRDYIIEKGE